MGQKDASWTRLVVSLALAGVISGLILVGIYMGTLSKIQENQAERYEKAIYSVLPGTSSVHYFIYNPKTKTLDDFEGKIATLKEEEKARLISVGFNDKGEMVGYGISASGQGFSDVIKLVYGYDPQKKAIVGMSVLESRETPGLGDKIYKDAEFQKNFEALSVSPKLPELVKHGKKTQAHQVDAITGATISSRAVTKILHDSIAYWLPLLPERVTPTKGGSK